MPRRHRQARGHAHLKRVAAIPPKRRCHALRKCATVKGRKPPTVRPHMRRPHRPRRHGPLKCTVAILRRPRCHALRKCVTAKGHKPSTVRLATHRNRPRGLFRRHRPHIQKMNRSPNRALRRAVASTTGPAERRSRQAILKTEHPQIEYSRRADLPLPARGLTVISQFLFTTQSIVRVSALECS
jgi:hypothetical protein